MNSRRKYEHKKSKIQPRHKIFNLCVMLLSICPTMVGAQQTSGGSLSIQLEQQLKNQQIQIDELRQQLENSKQEDHLETEEHVLDIAGFFDVTAQSTDNGDHIFDLGGFELDLQFDQGENFAVSTALVWDGEVSEVAVAVLDYHVGSHNVPTRGRLFGEPGYHIQFGRFDIPFGIDYEFFAAPDRPNITAPLTTQRIQNDGFNGDGLRAYGSWSKIDYAVYWTNSLFEDTGNSVGTRLGFFPGRDPFSVHNRDSQSDFSIGLSWLHDMDSDENERNTLQAMDIRWKYDVVELVLEYIKLDNIDTVTLPGGGSAGPADEDGFNSRLLIDFEPISFFVGYGQWKPAFTAALDPEDPATSYSVNKLNRLTIGSRYMIDDILQIKLEYLSHLGTSTAEPDFEKRKLTFQLVASF